MPCTVDAQRFAQAARSLCTRDCILVHGSDAMHLASGRVDEAVQERLQELRELVAAAGLAR